jgi:hypothetical protein
LGHWRIEIKNKLAIYYQLIGKNAKSSQSKNVQFDAQREIYHQP